MTQTPPNNFSGMLDAGQTTLPRVITVGQNAAYPPILEALQRASTLPETCRLMPCKYLNTIIEQDHWLVKRRVNPGRGYGAFHTARRTIQGYEAIRRLRNGQIEGIAERDVLAQNRVINQLFGLAASTEHAQSLLVLEIANAVIYYNMALLSKVYEQKSAARDQQAPAVIQGICPVAW